LDPKEEVIAKMRFADEKSGENQIRSKNQPLITTYCRFTEMYSPEPLNVLVSQ
jgi:hypothetical protein